MQEHSILYPEESFSRPQHTTHKVHSHIGVVDSWGKALDEKKLVKAVTVDFSNAFDMVFHSILLRKMHSSIWSERYKELKWFQDYLTGRRQRVYVRNEKSGHN